MTLAEVAAAVDRMVAGFDLRAVSLLRFEDGWSAQVALGTDDDVRAFGARVGVDAMPAANKTHAWVATSATVDDIYVTAYGPHVAIAEAA